MLVSWLVAPDALSRWEAALALAAVALLGYARPALGEKVAAGLVLASPFLLSGGGMDFNQKAYLDREGNANGVYDLGDFRAFYLRNPNLPRTGDMQGLIELLVPMGALNGQGSGKEVVR